MKTASVLPVSRTRQHYIALHMLLFVIDKQKAFYGISYPFVAKINRDEKMTEMQVIEHSGQTPFSVRKTSLFEMEISPQHHFHKPAKRPWLTQHCTVMDTVYLRDIPYCSQIQTFLLGYIHFVGSMIHLRLSQIFSDISETQNLTFAIFWNLKPKFLLILGFRFCILWFRFYFLLLKSQPFLWFIFWS